MEHIEASNGESNIKICGWLREVTVAFFELLIRGTAFGWGCELDLLREAWTIAIETMSWMELRRLNERSALVRTAKQLNINDPGAIRLAYGLIIETTRRKNVIDKLINNVVEPKKIGEYDQGLQAFLRLYVYQTRVVKNWGKYNLKEAENIAGLGRNILGWEAMREIEPILGFLLTRKIEPIIAEAPVAERIGLQTFNPTWFVEYCFKLFGKDDAAAFLQGNLNPPPTYIRINTLAGSEQEILAKLEAEGIKLEKTEQLKYTYKVTGSKQTLNNSASLKAGLFYIQDKASCFASEAANPASGSTVFDICAAPGAKTTFLAQLMQNKGSIVSMDFSAKRMKTWQKETSRMHTEIADSLVADARVSIPLVGEADLVVLDPPCTSSGVFAKQPSAKWRLSPKSIQNMSEVQLQLINNCADKVKPSGYLTYSTCSITEEENEGVVEAFLKAHPDFKLVEIEPKIGVSGIKGLTQCQRLYPHLHQCNGFFIAKMQKVS